MAIRHYCLLNMFVILGLKGDIFAFTMYAATLFNSPNHSKMQLLLFFYDMYQYSKKSIAIFLFNIPKVQMIFNQGFSDLVGEVLPLFLNNAASPRQPPTLLFKARSGSRTKSL